MIDGLSPLNGCTRAVHICILEAPSGGVLYHVSVLFTVVRDAAKQNEKNKTATECWNILRGELDSAIDSFVPMKKQGKRSKKKHLSKEAFRKIRYKQNMWRVYKHTGKDQDYVVYKEALNAATNEVRKSKRNFELKL